MLKYIEKKSILLQIIPGIILILGILWIYWPVLYILFSDLVSSEDYSYGLLLPFVSGYIVYLKWPQIRTLPQQPSWLGLVFIMGAFLLYILSSVISVYYLASLSFLVILIGLVFLTGGWNLFRLVAFPLILLFFMIPLPGLVMKQLTFPLQMVSSRLAAEMLSMINIPVVRHGNVLDLGVRQLQVVSACSGLRYVLSLLSLGIIFCYFYQRRLWKAGIVLLALVPAAIFANAIRVAGMGVFPSLQEGFLHSFSGWLIFLFCFVFFALVNWLLNYLQPPTASPNDPGDVQGSEYSPSFAKGTSSPYLMWAALALVLLAGPGIKWLSQVPPVQLLQSFDKFPLQLGSWQGKQSYLDPEMARIVGADDYLEANFTDTGGVPLSLWIGFFNSQNVKVEGRIHSPQVCLTGAGWQILESKIVEVAPGLPVRYLLIEQGKERQVVYYWYLQRGHWLASEYSTRLYMGLEGLLRRRNDGSIVRLITPAVPTTEAAEERLNKFTHLLVPILPKFIPD
jgi:exosortase D (VPLPA-CTERM-specific)